MMPENDINVLCHATSYLEAELSHSVNLPILKYIKEVELLHQNLIKVRTPAKVRASKIPVRCRLVIIPKAGYQKKQILRDEVPFDTILISRPMVVDSEPKPIANDSEPEEPPPGANSDDEIQNQYDETTVTVEPEVQDKEAKKHIHPCICDLTKAQRNRIDSHLRDQSEEQSKFLDRLQQIEQEVRLLEQEAEQKELDCQVEYELMGDLSSCLPKRKPKKAFARRLSMVSLGIKQVINWRKPPKIGVKYNRVFELRKDNTKYCKGSPATSEEHREIVISEVVEFPVTKASQLRKRYNEKWIEEYNKQQDVKGKYPNRPEFVINYSKLWAKD